MPERLFCVLDTNALHQLAGLLQWDAFGAAWKAKKCTAGWMPWVLTEITATNLYNKGKGCDDARLRRLLRAAMRYDELSERGILPDADQLLWQDIHQIAEATVPPFPRADETARRREAVDTFLRLKEASQVRWELTPPGIRIIYELSEGPWKCDVRFGYQSTAQSIIETVKKHTTCSKDSPLEQLIEEATPLAQHWLAYKTNDLGVAPDVVKRALQRPEELASSSWCMGIVLGWYLVRKALGIDVKAVKENDYRDNAILAYHQLATYLVTNDIPFTALAQSLLKSSERVISFQRLVEIVLS